MNRVWVGRSVPAEPSKEQLRKTLGRLAGTDSPYRQVHGPKPVEIALECVAFKPSPVHGWGCFAAKPIPSGAKVIEYLGQKIDKRESQRRCRLNNEYIFYLDEQFDLDGNAGWNPAKFINHGCAPNCDAELIEGRIWIVARRPIQPDEEITFNYGYDLEDFREHPCHCGSPNCVGYIVAEEFFEAVKRKTAAPA